MSDKHKMAALTRGEARSAEIKNKVQVAMDTIVAEIKANDGIYPANGGAVSKNEVARRAGISLSTLFSPKQKELGERVSLWLETLKKRETVGRMRVRRSFAQRAEDWKARYLALQDTHIKTELDLQSAQAERDEALALAEKLRDENSALVEQLRMAGSSKVIPFTKRND